MSENFFRGKRRQIILILVCNLIAAILFSSWYRTQKISASEDGKVEVNYSLAGQDSLWGQLDFSVFRKLNGSLKNHRAAQSFWALANNRASDLISAACMGAVLWFGATRIASPVEKIERLKVGLFLLLAALVFVQVLRVSLFDFYRPSASLVIEEGTIRLSQLDHVGWRLKDSSQRSFPGDHGSVLLVGAVYVSCFSIVRWSVVAFLVAIFFTLPRVVAGGHWATDVLVGSVFVTLISTSWVLCLSRWGIGPGLFHRPALFLMRFIGALGPSPGDSHGGNHTAAP